MKSLIFLFAGRAISKVLACFKIAPFTCSILIGLPYGTSHHMEDRELVPTSNIWLASRVKIKLSSRNTTSILCAETVVIFGRLIPNTLINCNNSAINKTKTLQ
jgi:hypothetical protein